MNDFALTSAFLIMTYLMIVTAGWYVRHRNEW